jgi:hypothetical protein
MRVAVELASPVPRDFRERRRRLANSEELPSGPMLWFRFVTGTFRRLTYGSVDGCTTPLSYCRVGSGIFT